MAVKSKWKFNTAQNIAVEFERFSCLVHACEPAVTFSLCSGNTVLHDLSTNTFFFLFSDLHWSLSHLNSGIFTSMNSLVVQIPSTSTLWFLYGFKVYKWIYKSHPQWNKYYPDIAWIKAVGPLSNIYWMLSFFSHLIYAPIHPHQMHSSQDTQQPMSFSLCFSSEHFPGCLENS